MKHFASVTFTLVALLAITFSPVAAGNPFAGVTTTAAGYATWDSDMINIESVSQTGAGVYVAVLDTGLVPNWRDYFPEARIATALGTGFDQSVSFKAQNDVCGLGVEVGPLRQTTWVGSTGWGRWRSSPGIKTLQAMAGWLGFRRGSISRKICQMNPHSSRATATMTLLRCLPRASSWLMRLCSRVWAFQAQALTS